MSAPKVVVKTVNIATRVPSFEGINAAIVIPGAKRGPVGVPTHCSGETDILNRFTPEGRVGIGYDIAYFSALVYAQKGGIYILRPENGSGFGGALFKTAASAAANASLAAEMLDPEAYVFASSDEVMLFHGADPGAWNNNLKVALLDNSTKEPTSFYVVVYQNNVEVERTLCSRTQGKVDGYGRNIYVEDALQSSRYIRCVDNIAVPAATSLKFSAETAGDPPVTTITAISLAMGHDGDPVVDADMVLAIDTLKNSDSIPVTMLLDGGRATPVYQTALIAIAEGRGDCVALLSVPYSREADSDYLNMVVEYRNTVLNVDSTVAALYTPHVKAFDKFNNRDIYVSPEAYAGSCVSETAANYEIWYPAAGWKRGNLNVTDLRRRYSKEERDILADAGINTLRYAVGKGIAVWGQMTLSKRPNPEDRLNVTLLRITIQPAVAEALDDFIFDFNDDSTRILVESMIDNYMSNIRGKRGVYDFEVVCNDDNNTQDDIDNYRLNVTLYIEPTKGAERIEFTTVITRTGGIRTQLALAA